jgi:hypothetical protein
MFRMRAAQITYPLAPEEEGREKRVVNTQHSTVNSQQSTLNTQQPTVNSD